MKKSLADLELIRESTRDKINMKDSKDEKFRIVVGMATCGIAAGSRPVMEALNREIEKRNLKNTSVVKTGCIGVCRLEPIIEVYEQGKDKVTYVAMTAEKAVRVINDHIVNGKPIAGFTAAAAE